MKEDKAIRGEHLIEYSGIRLMHGVSSRGVEPWHGGGVIDVLPRGLYEQLC